MEPDSPAINLLVIRSSEIDRAVTFYEAVGLRFIRHAHGNGAEHFASEAHGFVFEIYPERNAQDKTTTARIGFKVSNVDRILVSLRAIDAEILTTPSDTEWGRRAVVRDFDGHTIELITPLCN